ncbi:hypothetical protein ACFCX4_31945 [Kitasatospora sp. NPDC056327]|uniref:hypothetical protein n=1 Tax=Kitasatospora sp. NPDC056327 TaxID=3345785 RepID=UPI0035E012D2
MRTPHRRSLAIAAAATLVSGAALTAAAPGASALPRSGGATGTVRQTLNQGSTAPAPGGGPQTPSGPVTTTLTGLPASLTAGQAAEFTATLRNHADHAVEVTTGFTVANAGSGIRETHLGLDHQGPAGGQWKPATLLPGARTGATWNLDTFATRVSVPAGSAVTYRLRLAVTADAPAGRATAGFRAVVSDPTLPPETRTSEANSPHQEFTVVAAGPTGAPTSAPAPGVPYLGLDAVPAVLTAGGGAGPFRLTLANRSGKDIAFLPELTLRGGALPSAAATGLEFQTPDGEWLPATADAGQAGSGRLTLTLRTGDKESSLVRLRDGESRTINVRLAFTRDAPAGVLSLQFTGTSLPAAGGGAGLAATSSAVDVTVTAAPSTPTAAPSTPAGDGGAPAAPSTGAPSATGTGGPAVGLAAVGPSPDPSGTPAAVPAARTTQTPPSEPAAPAPAVTVTVAAPVPAVDLASTGGSPTNTPMAITGATAIAMGIGTLVVAHRRQRTRPAPGRPRPAGGPAADPGTPPHRPAAGPASGPAPR